MAGTRTYRRQNMVQYTPTAYEQYAAAPMLLQQRADNTRAAIAQEQQALAEKTFGLETEARNAKLQEYQDKIQGVIDSYGGDVARASRDIVPLIGQARNDPAWQHMERLEKERENFRLMQAEAASQNKVAINTGNYKQTIGEDGQLRSNFYNPETGEFNYDVSIQPDIFKVSYRDDKKEMFDDIRDSFLDSNIYSQYEKLDSELRQAAENNQDFNTLAYLQKTSGYNPTAQNYLDKLKVWEESNIGQREIKKLQSQGYTYDQARNMMARELADVMSEFIRINKDESLQQYSNRANRSLSFGNDTPDPKFQTDLTDSSLVSSNEESSSFYSNEQASAMFNNNGELVDNVIDSRGYNALEEEVSSSNKFLKEVMNRNPVTTPMDMVDNLYGMSFIDKLQYGMLLAKDAATNQLGKNMAAEFEKTYGKFTIDKKKIALRTIANNIVPGLGSNIDFSKKDPTFDAIKQEAMKIIKGQKEKNPALQEYSDEKVLNAYSQGIKQYTQLYGKDHIVAGGWATDQTNSLFTNQGILTGNKTVYINGEAVTGSALKDILPGWDNSDASEKYIKKSSVLNELTNWGNGPSEMKIILQTEDGPVSATMDAPSDNIKKKGEQSYLFNKAVVNPNIENGYMIYFDPNTNTYKETYNIEDIPSNVQDYAKLTKQLVVDDNGELVLDIKWNTKNGSPINPAIVAKTNYSIQEGLMTVGTNLTGSQNVQNANSAKQVIILGGQ